MSLPAWVRRAAPIALAASVHVAVLGGAPLTAFAQGGGAAALIQKGAALYDDQAYEESIQTLSAALVRPGTSQAEKIEIYRLLAFNYIILKRAEEGDAAVRGILVLKEDFALATTESPRFRDFFDGVKKKWVAEGKPGKVVEGVAEKPVKMQHSSPAEIPPGSPIKLSGTIEDPDGKVKGVQLAYRTGAKGKFVTLAATYTLGEFHATVPKDAVKPPLIEYYLTGVDKGGLPIVSRGDAATPLRVVVPAPSGSVLGSPFFWVPVGLLVVGGAVATGIILSTGSKQSHVTVAIKE